MKSNAPCESWLHPGSKLRTAIRDTRGTSEEANMDDSGYYELILIFYGVVIEVM